MRSCNVLFVFCLLALTAVPDAEATCPRGSLASLDGDTRCFAYISSGTEYLNAEQTCVDLGGHLASVGNGFVNTLITENGQNIYQKTNATEFWLGGSDLYSQGVWAWTDNAKWTYSNWMPGQPDQSAGSDCVAVELKDGSWVATSCFDKKPFVCEVPQLPEYVCPAFCDSEWAYFNESNSCYKVMFDKKWNDAEAACVSEGAHLASIHSPSENTFVSYLAHTDISRSTPHMSWIGLYTNDRNANWHWTDGSPVDYFYWAPSQPDKPGKEDCVQIYSDESEWPAEKGYYEKWNNYNCNNECRAFICKKPANKA